MSLETLKLKFLSIGSFNFSILHFLQTMPKARTKIIDLTDDHEYPSCCTNRNCRSHWQTRLSSKLKARQTLDSSIPFDLLSKLFQFTSITPTNCPSNHPSKSNLLRQHQIFSKQLVEQLTNDAYSFIQINLQHQFDYRRVCLNRFKLNERLQTYEQLKINRLQIDHFHSNSYLNLTIISAPIFTRSSIHLIVQDENSHCLRLSIYNWSYFSPTRQLKPPIYVENRLRTFLTPRTTLILLNPWLKRCRDGEIGLRCESPNTDLLVLDFDRFDIEQLRQFGNSAYQSDDNQSAIECYTFGLKQLDKQHDDQMNLKGQSIGPKTDEYEQHRIRFISNRCACYVRERHPILALADTGIVLSHLFEIPKTTTGKLLFRCLAAHLQLGLYDKVEQLLRSHRLGAGLEHPASMSILSKELLRLKNEKYDLIEIFKENQSPRNFIDLSLYHHEHQRFDLFEIRSCQQQPTYPNGSLGLFALQDIPVGTLLIVEQSFASIDKRTSNDERSLSINFLRKSSRIECYSNETLRFLNEIEKQLEIGHVSPATFEKLQLMQPIRQWLEENGFEQDITEDLIENYDQFLIDKYKWKQKFTKRTCSYLPWKVLLQTEEQNPFKSRLNMGWYSVSSMMNHSCLPNCIWYLIGDYVFIYVVSNEVKQGDELTISYCPLWISSANQRRDYLRKFEIDCCHCRICCYDRSQGDEYENQLKQFRNYRALARRKNITEDIRTKFTQKLNNQFENLRTKFADRPVDFIQEFLDLEKISPNNDNDAFLRHLSTVCKIDQNQISNPLFLFGLQMNMLINRLERSPELIINQWTSLLEYLYKIYTFQTSNNILQDHKQFFSHLFQTQSYLIEE